MDDKIEPITKDSSLIGSQRLSREVVTAGMDKRTAKRVTDEIIDLVSDLVLDPELAESYLDNWVTFNTVLSTGRHKMTDYANAVKFVSFRLMDASIIDAYAKTFPVKVGAWKVAGWADKDIASQASRYAKFDIVVKMMMQAQVPTHILHMDLFNKTILDLAREGVTAKSDVARVSALTSVLQYTKPPEEVKKIQLDIGVSQSGADAIADLRAAADLLMNAQEYSIVNGDKLVSEIANQNIVDVVVND